MGARYDGDVWSRGSTNKAGHKMSYCTKCDTELFHVPPGGMTFITGGAWCDCSWACCEWSTPGPGEHKPHISYKSIETICRTPKGHRASECSYRCRVCGFANDDCRCPKPPEMTNVSTSNIRQAWRYHDGVKWCFVYAREDAGYLYHEAELCRVRVLAEYQGEILKAEVL